MVVWDRSQRAVWAEDRIRLRLDWTVSGGQIESRNLQCEPGHLMGAYAEVDSRRRRELAALERGAHEPSELRRCVRTRRAKRRCRWIGACGRCPYADRLRRGTRIRRAR